MSFDIHEASKHEAGGGDMFFGQKPGTVEKIQHDPYHTNIVVPKDLFESITEGHYLPELVGAHDDTINTNELLDSLVEKGCEDNQILGAFDKLAQLVGHNSTEYNDDDDDMLLHDAPVTDIIERLEQSMSPGQNSITAAQGLLHLQQISEDLANEQMSSEKLSYNNESFEEAAVDCDIHESTLQMDSINEHESTLQMNTINEDEPIHDTNPIEDGLNDAPVTRLEIPEENISSTDQAQETCNYLKVSADGTANENVIENVIEDAQAPLVKVVQQTFNEIAHDSFNEVVQESSFNEEVEEAHANMQSEEHEITDCNEFIDNPQEPDKTNDEKGNFSPESIEEMLPTDLSFKHIPPITEHIISRDAETTEGMTDDMSEKSDELPKDLSCHKRVTTPNYSPKTVEIQRPPSRESDAMQSPQPSGIPAVPSSPELFMAPHAKSNKSLFLETLLASPSPKMIFSSELTITKHQSEPLNLGKHRKSASPTVSSCSDEIKKIQKEYGEPEDKRIKKESADALAMAKTNKICSTKTIEDIVDNKHKKNEKPPHQNNDEISPLKQLQRLKVSNDFIVPDPLLVPKDKLNDIITSPEREIPALLLQRPELRLPEAFAFPAILQDPDILVISLSQLENILENKNRKFESDFQQKLKEHKTPTSAKSNASSASNSAKSSTHSEGPPKQIPSMEALAGDIDAATSAALNQMLWLPYLSQIEAAVACSQNADFLKALNSSGYSSAHGSYADLSQMFSPASRFMNPAGFPMISQMDYNNQLELAMWQEAMNHSSNVMAQRGKQTSAENQLKELAKTVDGQNPYLHSPKGLPRSHSAARTSPIAHNYNTSCQRNAMNNANQFFPGMYPNINSNIRPNLPLSGLQMSHFNTNIMAAQRSARVQHQQKSPTSSYFHNNNYLQSLKQQSSSRVPQSPTHKRSAHHESSKDATNRLHSNSRPSSHCSSGPTDDIQKPRISVRSLHNLLEPSQPVQQSKRLDYMPYHQPSLTELMTTPSLSHESTSAASHNAKMRRQMLDASLQRRMLGHDEGEVGSTTAHDDAVPPPMHPDHQTHLWHPLFGNQKGYNSPWNWTTVTVNGD